MHVEYLRTRFGVSGKCSQSQGGLGFRTGFFHECKTIYYLYFHLIEFMQVCMLILYILACISVVQKLKKILHHLNYTSQKFLHDLIHYFFSPKAEWLFYFSRCFLPDKAHIHQEFCDCITEEEKKNPP